MLKSEVLSQLCPSLAVPLSGPDPLDTEAGKLGYLEEMGPPLIMGELTLMVWT